MYRHVIWDFNGTLFNTYPVMAFVFQEILQEQGKDVSYESILEAMKISAQTAYQKYGFDADTISQFKERKVLYEHKAVQPFSGIPQICCSIQEHGGHNYILTHRGRLTFALLQAHQLTDVFREVVTPERGFARNQIRRVFVI